MCRLKPLQAVFGLQMPYGFRVIWRGTYMAQGQVLFKTFRTWQGALSYSNSTRPDPRRANWPCVHLRQAAPQDDRYGHPYPRRAMGWRNGKNERIVNHPGRRYLLSIWIRKSVAWPKCFGRQANKNGRLPDQGYHSNNFFV